MPVFCIPARVMGSIHHSAAALCLALSVVVLDHNGLVVAKQQHVTPFFQHGGAVFGQFQFPVVVSSHLIGQFHLAKGGVGGDNNPDSGGNTAVQIGQELGKLLLHIHIALAIAEILDALFLGTVAHRLDAQLLRPVGGVNDKCLLVLGMLHSILHGSDQPFPTVGIRIPCHIKVAGRALGVDEYGTGEPGGKRRLADALRTVDHYTLGHFQLSSCNLHGLCPPSLKTCPVSM